ncbi:hypothetical protein FS749_009189 [Ceratobasidium sp. UAMH 11750]|nr:hypothetical protein FS749_009189 [Ceratobasidium sp. UAMH 11750]
MTNGQQQSLLPIYTEPALSIPQIYDRQRITLIPRDRAYALPPSAESLRPSYLYTYASYLFCQISVSSYRLYLDHVFLLISIPYPSQLYRFLSSQAHLPPRFFIAEVVYGCSWNRPSLKGWHGLLVHSGWFATMDGGVIAK